MAEDDRIKALREAIASEKIGSQSAMARLLGITQASVWGWLNRGTPLPAQHVLKVERESGVSRHELRPDIYPRDPAPAPPSAPDGRFEHVR